MIMRDNHDNRDAGKVADDNGEGRRPNGKFAPGNKLGGSRRGRANKLGVTIRHEILEAYEEKGGVEWLTKLPDALFVALLGKCLPKDIDVHGVQPITSREVAEQVLEMQRLGGGYSNPDPDGDD